jgi:hypothetical protein
LSTRPLDLQDAGEARWLQRTLAATAGGNELVLKRRIGARKLRPGRYVLTLVATDAAGNRAAPVTLRFRVLRAGR